PAQNPRGAARRIRLTERGVPSRIIGAAILSPLGSPLPQRLNRIGAAFLPAEERPLEPAGRAVPLPRLGHPGAALVRASSLDTAFRRHTAPFPGTGSRYARIWRSHRSR